MNPVQIATLVVMAINSILMVLILRKLSQIRKEPTPEQELRDWFAGMERLNGEEDFGLDAREALAGPIPTDAMLAARKGGAK